MKTYCHSTNDLAVIALHAARHFSRRHGLDESDCHTAALMAAHRAGATFDAGKAVPFSAYAGLLMRQEMLKISVRARKRREREMSWSEIGAEDQEYDPADDRAPPPGESIDRETLLKACEGLPPHLRTAVEMRFFHGCGFQKIGALLGISHEAARLRISRAVKILRKKLTSDTFTY